MAWVSMTVHPSRYSRYGVIGFYLCTLWPLSALVSLEQWLWLAPCWLYAFYHSLCQLLGQPFTLSWDGRTLLWQDQRYQLLPSSRVWPFALSLQLSDEQGHNRSLWLFSDSLSTAHFRQLARAVTLSVARSDRRL